MSMNHVKVAHITTIDMSLRYLLLNQLRSIQQAGYEVVGISSPGPDVAQIEAAGIRHVATPITRNFTPLADLVSLWRLYDVLRQERFMIVHTHTPKAGLLGQIAARLARTPVVVNTLHGFYFHTHMRPAARRFYISLEQIAARCSDVILSQNHEDIETAIREHICLPEKIKYLGNGIDLTTFDPDCISPTDLLQRRQQLGLAADAPVVGFVGRLAAKRKGFLDFLSAARQVAEHMPAARFLIVGDADHGKPDAVEPSAAAEYGIADRCLFLGQRPNHELPLLYRLMSVLVLPSIFEGMPRSVMEACAMGIPTVVSDVKGNREVVENGRNGVLVPYGHVEALRNAIVDVLTSDERARNMSEAGRRIASERFDERLVFAKVVAQYQCLLHEKNLSLPHHQPISGPRS